MLPCPPNAIVMPSDSLLPVHAGASGGGRGVGSGGGKGGGGPTRRAFLRSAGAAAVVVAAAPRIVLASNKSGRDPIVLGADDHKYEVIHDWAQLPADSGLAFGNTHGVAVDSQGLIYIKHTVHASATKPDAVCVFDPDGKFVRSWGAEYKGGAHGLHLHKEKEGDFLYLCDQARGVVDKTTLNGERVWSKGCPMESGVYNNPAEYHPTNIAMIPAGLPAPYDTRAGEFFVADGYGKSWIHHYNAKGDYLGFWGGPGGERGQLSCPHGLMVDARDPASPMLVVADRSNARLQFFTLDGRHIKFVKDEMKAPCHFDTRAGTLLVPDLQARVTLLDKDNKLIAHLGDGQNYDLRGQPREQFTPGKFIAPHGAIFDKDGNIFVVEWVEVGRVTKLRKV